MDQARELLRQALADNIPSGEEGDGEAKPSQDGPREPSRYIYRTNFEACWGSPAER